MATLVFGGLENFWELTLHVPFLGLWFKEFGYVGGGVVAPIHVPTPSTPITQAGAHRRDVILLSLKARINTHT